MLLFAQTALALLLLGLGSFVPGFYFVRWLRWRPMETLVASVGLSLILLYLFTGTVYLAGSGRVPAAPATAAILLCGGLLYLCRRDAARLVAARRVRDALRGHVFLLVWTLVVLAMIRVYSGGGWGGDWVEHYQRSLFFLLRLSLDTPVLHGPLPGRPPMMNVLASFFLALTGSGFAWFQVIFTFLNLLFFLSCALLLPRIGGRRSRLLPLVFLFALNPAVIQSATYTWTKALTAFYVVLGLALYLAAWRRQDTPRMVGAFLSLAAGLLVHYSAGPYVVFLAAHYLLTRFWGRRRRWRELAWITVSSGLLLATWFTWSAATFGVRTTFLSNTSYTSSRAYAGSNVEKTLSNLRDSIVPAQLRDATLYRLFDQTNEMGRWRDHFFMPYQVNVIFRLGLLGGPLAVLLFAYRRHLRNGESRFWLAFTAFLVVAGIAVVGERDRFGLGHLTLLPQAGVGLAFLASAWNTRRLWAALLLAGGLVDFGAGVLLHSYIQNREDLHVASGQAAGGPAGSLSIPSQSNWRAKHVIAPQIGVAGPAGLVFFGDRVAGAVGVAGPMTALFMMFGGLSIAAVRQAWRSRPG